MDVLVVAPVREELGQLEGDVVGVGPIVSAIGATTLLQLHHPRRVVLVGTAGTYPGGPRVGSVIVSRRMGLSHGVAVMGLGYVPRAPEDIDGDPALIAALGLPAHDVLTVGAITTDPALTRRLADGWSVEHMETFSVALACRRAGVPFVAVLGIANEVGPDAHVQWLTHRDDAQEAARLALLPLTS
ncbi:MAG TPA: hypothetical protein ENK18_01575 [Deltaproteobacteria bacterium]|nr:hypothetical protein [Deltaproteobacteria bacterium]